MAGDSENTVNPFGIPRTHFLDRLPVQSDRYTIDKILDRRPTTAYLELQCTSQGEIIEGILDRETRNDDDGEVSRAQSQQRNDDLLAAGNLQANMKRALLMRKWLDREARKSGRKVDWSRHSRFAAYEATTIRNLHLLPPRWHELKAAIKPMGWKLLAESDEDDTAEPSGSRRATLRKRAVTSTRSKTGSKKKTDEETAARSETSHPKSHRANAAAKNTTRRTRSTRNVSPSSTSNEIRNPLPAGQVIPPLTQHPEQLQESGDASTEDVIEAAVRSASNLLARKSIHSAGRIILIPLAVSMWTFHRAEGVSLDAMEERFGLLGGTKKNALGSQNSETAGAKTSKVAGGSTAAVGGHIKALAPANKLTVTGKRPSVAEAKRISSNLKSESTVKKRKRNEDAGQGGSGPDVVKKLKLLTGPRPDEVGAAMRASSDISGSNPFKDETEKNSEGQSESKEAEMELLADLIGEGYLDAQSLIVDFNDLNAKAGRAMKGIEGFHTMLKARAAKRVP